MVVNLLTKQKKKMELIASGDVTTLLASVGTGVSDTLVPLLPIIAIAVAIPLTFYAIHAIMGLFPKTRGSRRA